MFQLEETALLEKLKEAYESTTQKDNYFFEAIKELQWDEIFKADGEICFCKGQFSLIVENLNPFEEAYPPSVTFQNEVIYFRPPEW